MISPRKIHTFSQRKVATAAGSDDCAGLLLGGNIRTSCKVYETAQ